jgi:hypothetical protein
MGATVYELAPGAPEPRLHMHFGAEEMFFVLSGRPLMRNQQGTEQLTAGDFVSKTEDGYVWVATRDPDPKLLAQGGDPGIIARFEIPIE